MSQLRASINYSMYIKKLKQIEDSFNVQLSELESDPLMSQASTADISESNDFDIDNVEDLQNKEIIF